MLRLTRPVASASNRVLVRCFSVGQPAMAEGDTGSPKSRGYLAEKDQFARREQANENYYVYQHEQEKLAGLKAKMKEQQKHLRALQEHIDDFTKDQGGEKN